MLEGSDSVAIAKPLTIYTNGSQVPAPHSIWNLLLLLWQAVNPQWLRTERKILCQLPSFTGALPLPLLKWWIFFSPSPDLLRMTPFCLLERAPNLELWIVFKIVVRNTALCIKIFWNLALPYSQMDACWQVSVTLSGIVPSVFCLKVS